MESRLWGFNSWGFTERMMESPINPQPRWMETTAGSTQPLPPPIPPASSTAPSSALSAPVSMEDILARIARLEARLETSERRCAPAFTPSRGEADMSFGAQRDWRVPSWDPGSHPSPQSWRPPLPQQAPWDSPWLRTYHEPPLPQQAPWDSPWLRANHEPSPAPRPSLADLHAPWESPWPRIAPDCGSNRSDWEYSILCVPDPPPPHIDSVSCSIEPQREKRERGLAPFSLGLKVAEEKGDSKTLGAAENPSPNSVHATSGSGLGDGDANNAAQSSAADTNDNEFEKTLACTDALMVRGSKVAKEGDDFVVAFAKEGDELERASAHSHFGWAFLFQAQEGAVLLGLIPNKKSGVGSGGKGLKLREVSRRSIIFGIYALEEVYKDFLYLHLEDKVILKGGGVDTLII